MLEFGSNWNLTCSRRPRIFCVSQHRGKEKQDRDGTNFEFGQADGDGVPPLVSALKASGRQNAAKIGNHFSPPIPEAQKQAAKLFGASETWFLVGGDFEFRFESKWSKILDLEEAISQMNVIHVAGRKRKELEKEGKKAAADGIPLIVDEAHGAHFGFSDQLPYSALQQGADLVLQSTHKVLCSLTQSSMLHLSTKTSVDRERISMCLQSLQTTSPNNLLLASLDAARAQLNENPKTIFNEAINLAAETRYLLKNIPGISVLDSSSFPNFQTRDPLRLTLGFWQLGLSGYQANDILHKDLMVICELVGSRSLTFAFNLGTCREQIQRLVSAIQQVSPIHSSLSNGKFVNGLVADENSVMGPLADIEIEITDDILHKDLMVICELVGSRSLTFAFNLGTCREQIQRLVSAIQQVSPIRSSLSNGKFVNGLVADENSVMGPLADIEIGLNPKSVRVGKENGE
ncbi:hypothetical protein EZV62_007504 [Acer yangbiense]|uniref:Orn/Lys/Arg decarboxylases family 1 pyridoxal-P attachment site domain-containing protein n=1 Tax=Acer yangbiense TaxID=1000413 RepID=A0A5C7IBS4_9ROSI|nr:hypothetical protein EZV62_007504 [Acer yangbiense]